MFQRVFFTIRLFVLCNNFCTFRCSLRYCFFVVLQKKMSFFSSLNTLTHVDNCRMRRLREDEENNIASKSSQWHVRWASSNLWSVRCLVESRKDDKKHEVSVILRPNPLMSSRRRIKSHQIIEHAEFARYAVSVSTATSLNGIRISNAEDRRKVRRSTFYTADYRTIYVTYRSVFATNGFRAGKENTAMTHSVHG